MQVTEDRATIAGETKPGFSLIEIILVLALVALLTGLVVVDTDSLLRTFSSPPVDQRIQQALLEARDIARLRNEEVTIAYADRPARLYILSSDGSTTAEWPLYTDPLQSLRLSFLTPEPFTRPETGEPLKIAASSTQLVITSEGFIPPTVIEWQERFQTKRALVDSFTMILSE